MGLGLEIRKQANNKYVMTPEGQNIAKDIAQLIYIANDTAETNTYNLVSLVDWGYFRYLSV